jgi:2-haloacid dehalogenase
MKLPLLANISVCVFDAYGTLFDFSSIVCGAEDVSEEHRAALSELWRFKELQYTWLRGLAVHHVDFWQISSDALEFAIDALGIEDPGLHERLMQRYLTIQPYPEVPEVLATLTASGIKTAILSNGTPTMLSQAVRNAGLESHFDAILSVEEVGVFKPHPSVYSLPGRRLAVPEEKICFISANGWDAHFAKATGLKSLWCNRFGQPAERIPSLPDGEIKNLTMLVNWVKC